MPIYEFQCKHCGEVFSELVKLGTEEYLCPKCGEKADKIMSVPNFVLKGKCWSSDGYSYNKEKVKK